MQNDFRKYMHVERYGKPTVQGILDGECFVFPKIDGTNASIWFDGEKICAGSRNRQLSIDNDNAGFMRWVTKSSKVFEPFFGRYPQYIVYGEWLVPHTLKTYKDYAWNEFYLFDVYDREQERLLSYYDYSNKAAPFFNVLTPLAIIKNPDIEDIEKVANESNVFLIKEDCGVGEGVVIKNYDFINIYGDQIWAKIVVEKFKEEKYTVDQRTNDGSTEAKLARRFVTQGRVNKIKADMRLSGPIEGKRIPELFGRVYNDFVKEEIVDIALSKKYTIDFRSLYAKTVEMVKIYSKEIF